MMHRTARLLAATAAMALLAAACGDGGNTVSEADSEAQAEFAKVAMNGSEERNAEVCEAARDKGSIMLYVTLPPPEVDAQIAGFNKAYPDLKVEYYRGGSTGSMINRVLTEAGAGSLDADVSWNNDHIAYVLDSQDLFLAFRSAYADSYDEKFMITDNSYPSYINYWMWAYNTNKLSEADLPRKYDDLLNERWVGDFTVAAYADWFFGLWQILGDERAEDYFTKLGQQKPFLADQFTPALLPVIQGEQAMTVSTVSGVLSGQQKKSAPLEGYFPDETTVARTVPISVLAEGGNPEGGLCFAEYVLSPEGQQLLADRGRVPGHADVDPEPAKLRPKDAELIDYSKFIPEEDEWQQRMSEVLGG
jgi:iron(III) transport system substrate-binding protein